MHSLKGVFELNFEGTRTCYTKAKNKHKVGHKWKTDTFGHFKTNKYKPATYMNWEIMNPIGRNILNNSGLTLNIRWTSHIPNKG
jgi:hypothetical protein